MGIECEHGQLARSCNICELEALLKSSEEEMLFWRHAHRDADKRVAELEAEDAVMRADIAAALRINNPCGHTGFESSTCEICGYPDPRKMIAALKAEIEIGKKREDAMHERWKKATAKYPNGADGCCCLFDKDEKQINWCSVHAELRDERDRLRERLETFADFILEECDEWALAHDAARKAKQVLGGDHD